MKENPRLAIVIVNYNNAEDTIECLQSLKNISYGNAEIIVVDNGSTDGSVEKLQNFKAGFSLLTSEANLGFAGGNNIGIRYAIDHKAGYVLLLNNDTVVDPGFIEPLLATVLNDNKAGAVGGKIYYYSDRKRIWFAGGRLNRFTAKTKHIGKNRVDRGQYNTAREVDFITGCMILVPVAVIEKAGLLDEEYFLYYEDIDWNLSIKNQGYKIIFNPSSKIYHKESSSTKKLDDIKSYYYYRNIYYFARKHFSRPRGMFVFFYLRLYFLMIMIKNLVFVNSGKVKIMREVISNMGVMRMGQYRPRATTDISRGRAF